MAYVKVCPPCSTCIGPRSHLQMRSTVVAQSIMQAHSRTLCLAVMQPWLQKVLAKLPADQQEEFKTKSQPALKFLVGKVKELQLCAALMLVIDSCPHPMWCRPICLSDLAWLGLHSSPISDFDDTLAVFCSFTSESMDPEATMVYAYYAEGSSSPTFLYPK